MTWREAEIYIGQIGGHGFRPGLSSIRELCARLGNPQASLSFVHVAGTNGKGSVLAFVSSVLKAAGYKTGRYLSPTLFSYRERFQVNGHMISKVDFCFCLEQVKRAADHMEAEGFHYPTPFEIDTALSFLYFSYKKCDIVVLETGLGGTDDATNIIENTLIAILTPISMDHINVLGNTISEIAEHKAGIIKRGCTVISSPQPGEASPVIEKICSRKACPLIWSRPDQVSRIRFGTYKKTAAIMKSYFSYGALRDMCITLAGTFQIGNAILAIEALTALTEKGYPVSETALRKGLKETTWPGRFQLLQGDPVIVADGAHNVAAAEKLMESVRFYFTNKQIIYIIGILRDKEYQKIIGLTCGYAEQIITVTTPGPRGMHSYELAAQIRPYHQSVTCADSIEEAIELAGLLAGKDSVVVAFGSLSYLGNLIHIIEKKNKQS